MDFNFAEPKAYILCKPKPSNKIFQSLVLLVALCCCFHYVRAGTETFHLSLPNTDTGFERFLGLGLAFPHPYYQRPRHRYPVYDRDGRGSLLYGYGGNEVYPYRVFDAVDGHHKKK